MAKALQRRRGTTEEHKSFTGLEGEFTYDTTEKRVVAHDGVTAGGIPMAKKSEADDKLPLSGGTMTGVISFQGTDGRTKLVKSAGNGFFIENYDSNGVIGSRLVLRSPTHETQAGRFALDANDGTNKTALVGFPDGTLVWGDDDVLTSSNGLQLSGGTMSGTITAVPVALARDTTDSYIQVRAAPARAGGASLQLTGVDNTALVGAFTLRATDGSVNKDLIGKPDDSLTWGGANIARSVNGASADASGNVEISFRIVQSSQTQDAQKVNKTFTYTIPQNGVAELSVFAAGASNVNGCKAMLYVNNTLIASEDKSSKTGSASVTVVRNVVKGDVIKATTYNTVNSSLGLRCGSALDVSLSTVY